MKFAAGWLQSQSCRTLDDDEQRVHGISAVAAVVGTSADKLTKASSKHQRLLGGWKVGDGVKEAARHKVILTE